MPFYDRGTGQSVFIGPGTYKSGEAHSKLLKEPCATIMVSTLMYGNFLNDRNQFHCTKGRSRMSNTTLWWATKLSMSLGGLVMTSKDKT